MFTIEKSASSPWTNVYGVARTVLALGTLLTLACNPADFLFQPMGGTPPDLSHLIFPVKFSLFHLLPDPYLGLAKGLAIVILLLVASGWRPRITGLLHWWVSFSFAISGVVIEGGDQVTAILTLLLLPVTLTDPRPWHWSRVRSESAAPTLARPIGRLIAGSCFWVIRLQVAIIYFWAGTAKMRVPEWANGTALYYWFTHPIFGLSAGLEPVFMPLVTHPVLVTFLTWGVMAFEVTLFMGLVIDKRWRPLLLSLGLFFHFGIIVVHGLASFFFAMAGALILYLRPLEQEFRLPLPLKGLLSIAGPHFKAETQRTPILALFFSAPSTSRR